MGGNNSKETDANVKKLQQFQQQNGSQQQIQGMYTNQAMNHGRSGMVRDNPWGAVEQAKKEVNQAATMEMKALSNDFTIDSSSLKLERYQNSQDDFELICKFNNKANECSVTLLQQVNETVQKDQTGKILRLLHEPSSAEIGLANQTKVYQLGDGQEFRVLISLRHYIGKGKTTLSSHFRPIIIQAQCRGYQDPQYFYDALYYLNLSVNSAQVSVVKNKVLNPMGLFELDVAYGLNSNRTNEEDSKECSICLSEIPDTLLKPCKHVNMCYACAQVVLKQDAKCPTCRSQIDELVPMKINQ